MVPPPARFAPYHRSGEPRTDRADATDEAARPEDAGGRHARAVDQAARRHDTGSPGLGCSRPAIPRPAPSPRPAALAAAGSLERAHRRRSARVAPVRSARDRRPQPRPDAARPDRRLSARVDRRAPVRATGPVRGLQQGPLDPADVRAPVPPDHLGSSRARARGRRVRRARSARRRAARSDPPERRHVLDRPRAAGGHRLVLAPDEPGPGPARGARRSRHPRDRPARRQSAHLRPDRAPLPGRAPREPAGRGRPASASAAVALSRPRAPGGRRPGGDLRRPVARVGQVRRPCRAPVRVASSSRSTSREYGAQGT